MNKLSKRKKIQFLNHCIKYFSKPWAKYGFCYQLHKFLNKEGISNNDFECIDEYFPELEKFNPDNIFSSFWFKRDKEGYLKRIELAKKVKKKLKETQWKQTIIHLK